MFPSSKRSRSKWSDDFEFKPNHSYSCQLAARGGLIHLGPKVKINYLILDAKFILINMNYVKFFLFFRNFIDRKSLTKFFILVVADW